MPGSNDAKRPTFGCMVRVRVRGQMNRMRVIQYGGRSVLEAGGHKVTKQQVICSDGHTGISGCSLTTSLLGGVEGGLAIKWLKLMGELPKSYQQ